MSNIYNLEPQTEGLIKIRTNFGDLEVELFTKSCPKATQNFVQLCLNGSYNNTIFERVEKDFIAIGGGEPLESDGSTEEAFADEFHSRLRFTRRGLLATANTKKNENGRKFFFTLGPTPELQNKHTIFGRVKGNSIYTLVDLNECQVDEEFKPFSEKKIIEVSVLENPFTNLEKRNQDKSFKTKLDKLSDTDSESSSDDRFETPRLDNNKIKKLSFNYEEEEDEEEERKHTNGNQDSKSLTITLQPLKVEKLDVEDIPKSELRQSPTISSPITSTVVKKEEIYDELVDEPFNTTDSSECLDTNEKEKKLRQIRAEIQKFKEQLERESESKSAQDKKQAQHQSRNSSRESDLLDESDSIVLDIAPKKSKRREKETIDLLTNFKKKLKSVSENTKTLEPQKFDQVDDLEDPAQLDQVDGDDWLTHKFEAYDVDQYGDRLEDEFSKKGHESSSRHKHERDNKNHKYSSSHKSSSSDRHKTSSRREDHHRHRC